MFLLDQSLMKGLHSRLNTLFGTIDFLLSPQESYAMKLTEKASHSQSSTVVAKHTFASHVLNRLCFFQIDSTPLEQHLSDSVDLFGQLKLLLHHQNL